ncbi:MAG: hypothetical protein ACTSRS_15080 [Candidatus Helarchaeota archaeon]
MEDNLLTSVQKSLLLFNLLLSVPLFILGTYLTHLYLVNSITSLPFLPSIVVDYCIILLLVAGVILCVVFYSIGLPLLKKRRNVRKNFILSNITLGMSSTSLSLLGLMIVMIGVPIYGIIAWTIDLILTLVGLFNGFYCYKIIIDLEGKEDSNINYSH